MQDPTNETTYEIVNEWKLQVYDAKKKPPLLTARVEVPTFREHLDVKPISAQWYPWMCERLTADGSTLSKALAKFMLDNFKAEPPLFVAPVLADHDSTHSKGLMKPHHFLRFLGQYYVDAVSKLEQEKAPQEEIQEAEDKKQKELPQLAKMGLAACTSIHIQDAKGDTWVLLPRGAWTLLKAVHTFTKKIPEWWQGNFAKTGTEVVFLSAAKAAHAWDMIILPHSKYLEGVVYVEGSVNYVPRCLWEGGEPIDFVHQLPSDKKWWITKKLNDKNKLLPKLADMTKQGLLITGADMNDADTDTDTDDEDLLPGERKQAPVDDDDDDDDDEPEPTIKPIKPIKPEAEASKFTAYFQDNKRKAEDDAAPGPSRLEKKQKSDDKEGKALVDTDGVRASPEVAKLVKEIMSSVSIEVVKQLYHVLKYPGEPATDDAYTSLMTAYTISMYTGKMLDNDTMSHLEVNRWK